MRPRPLTHVILTLMLVACCSGRAAPQEDSPDRDEPSLLESWEETLLYGIDSEVLKVIETISKRGETELNEPMLKLLGETLNPRVRITVLDHFRSQESDIAEAVANRLLMDYQDLSGDLIIALIRYLAAIGSQKGFDLVMELTGHFDSHVQIAATRALGTDSFGAARRSAIANLLMDKLEQEELETGVRAEAVLALGGVRSVESIDLLVRIMEDGYEEKIVRLYAADSLGRIGDESAVPALRKAFAQDDALLRAYAAAALAEFELEEVVDVLIQGLKDENWKVRVTSAKGLGRRKAPRALDILIYKARKDPVNDVRIEACRAIGEIGARRAFDFLRDLYRQAVTPIDIRLACLEVLVEKDLSGSLGAVREVTERNLDREIFQTRILERTAQRLAAVRSPGLEPIFALFLRSADAAVRLHGIRGIVHNRFSGLRGEIRRLSEQDPHSGVRKEAAAALSSL